MPNPCDLSLDYLKNYEMNPEHDLFYAISHGVHRGILRPGKTDERETFIKKLKSKCKEIAFDTYGMFGIQPVWGDEFLTKLSNSKMALNLSRGNPAKYYSSNRIASIMGNGLLTFIDKKVQMNDFFNENEIIFYENITDLSDKIKFYSKNDYKRIKIAKNGKKKYFKLFNEVRVSKYILDISIGKETSLI